MRLENNLIVFESGFYVGIQRTIRLPEDGKVHSLPPGLGNFPMKRIQDYRDKVPQAWRDHGGVFIPMYEREAMWLSFSGPTCAVKVATGKVNAVSGRAFTPELQKPSLPEGASNNPEQDYMVCPDPQPWLDGFNVGSGEIRQFVAMQMGKGYTVEGQVTGKEEVGGIQILVVPPKKPINQRWGVGGALECAMGYYEMECSAVTRSASSMESLGAQMGLAQGGKMKQNVSADPYGIDTWDESKAERIFIHMVDATLWKKITGEECPASPVPATDYKGPYFHYDNGSKPVQGSGTLANVKPVSQKDKDHGFVGQQDDTSLSEGPKTIQLGKTNVITDGKW